MPVGRRSILAVLAAAPTLAAAETFPMIRAKPSPSLAAIAASLAAIPDGPALLASYLGDQVSEPLRDVAFVYDNAVALIALCRDHDLDAARRIGDGFLIALEHDRFWRDGRLRNAYRAGAITSPAPLPGHWDKSLKLWSEDGYQVGTASGNVAWAALALFHLAAFDPKYGAPARRLVAWLGANVGNHGVTGGFYGEEPNPTRLTWQSTEQNIDAAVVMRAANDPRAAICRDFVAAQFDPARGCFATGSGGGSTALDANLWPLLAFPDAPPSWRRALGWVRAHHQSEGGLGFRENPDGMWTEGTAQGAIAFQAAGDDRMAAKLRAAVASMAGPGGYLLAAKHEIRTGLAVGPNAVTDDFRYYPWPSLAATAWAALAETESNPFLI